MACLVFFALMSGCSEPSGVMGEIELPKSFDRHEYLAKHFEHLESYCKLLEYLYSLPDPDPQVVSEIERLILSKIPLAQTVSLDASDLDLDSVRALVAVLRVAENDRFGDAVGGPKVLDPAVEYLTEIQTDLEERREYLRSQIRY